MFNLIANAAAAAPAAAHEAGLSLMPASMCVKEEGQNPYGLVPALCEGGIVSQITFLVLLIMFIKGFLGKTKNYSSVPVEVAATYWHFVDALWIYLLVFFLVLGKN